MRSLSRTIIAALLVLGCQTSNAQTIGKPEWSDVPVADHFKFFTDLTFGPICNNGWAYAMVGQHPGSRSQMYSGYVFPPAASGHARTVPLTIPIPAQKDHQNVNAFEMIGDAPCIVYDNWEKETGKISLYAQLYEPETFAPKGGPVDLGSITLDTKKYYGQRIHILVQTTSDNSKILFYYDDLDQNGFRAVACWVTDRTLNPLWKGLYRLKFQRAGSEVQHFLSDDGRVYLSVSGVEVRADNMETNRDGQVIAKEDKEFYQHQATRLHEVQGEMFNTWEGDLPDGGLVDQAGFFTTGGEIMFAATILKSDEEGARYDWVLGRFDRSFRPVELARGAIDQKGLGFLGHVLVSSDDGYLPVGYLPVGQGLGGFFWLKPYSGFEVVKLNNELQKEWERYFDWTGLMSDLSVTNGSLRIPFRGDQSDIEDSKAGKEFGLPGIREYPLLFTLDQKGDFSIDRILSKEDHRGGGMTGIWGQQEFQCIRSCGSYVGWSVSKDHEGLVRVQIQ